jgi:hypothetical protein
MWCVAGSVYASARYVYRVWYGGESRQGAHDLRGREHADVLVGLQEPARGHRDVGRAHHGPLRRRRRRPRLRLRSRGALLLCEDYLDFHPLLPC